MIAANADKANISRDRVLGYLPLNTACRSAILIQNSLIAVQIYKGSLPTYESSSIALFNSRTNKIVKQFNVAMSQAPSNLQQHTLITDPLEQYLIVCDDFGIYIYSMQRAFKIYSKYSVPNTAFESPLPLIRVNQPLTRVRAVSPEELLIAKGSSLVKWNFQKNRAVSTLPEFLGFQQNQKIADFECDVEKQLLFVMIELLFTYEYCEIIIYDLDELLPLSTYRLDCSFLNRFWSVSIESGSISVMQSDLVKKKSMVTFLRLNPDFEMKKVKSHEVEGWTLQHLGASKEISCIIISQMVDTAFKRVWGFFEHAEDRFLKAIYSVKQDTGSIHLPRVQKIFEYLDGLGCFVGFDHGAVFLTKKHDVIKRNKPRPSKKFWEYVGGTPQANL